MNNPLPDPIQDLLWRRKLTAEARAALDAWLKNHPETRDTLTVERALTSAIERLPDAPVASNFTARVLEELERIERRKQSVHSRPAAVWRWFSGWLPRAAAVILVVGISVLGWRQYRVTVRSELASSLAEQVAKLGPEVLENFNSVQHLAEAEPDLKLLKALE